MKSESPARARSAISVASILSVSEPPSARPHTRHVLIPLDNSTHSQEALRWAIEQLYRPGDKFHLLHVIPEPDTLHAFPGVYIPPDDAQEREEFKQAIAMVRAAFAPSLQSAEVPADVHLIVAADHSDSVAGIILDKARDLPAAAVVMASHGKRGLQEFWVGSVTQLVMKQTSVPLTICPSGAS